MLNKNTAYSVLIIGSLAFLFFNEYGIWALMNKQSVIRQQKKELKKIHNEKKKLQIDNKNIEKYTKEELDDLRKQHGITLPNEYYYMIKSE